MTYYSKYDTPEEQAAQLQAEKHMHVAAVLAVLIVSIFVTACVLGGIYMNSHRAPVDTDVRVRTEEVPR